MALWLYLHFPRLAFEVVARGLPPDELTRQPLIVVDGEGARARVSACSPEARAAGVVPGASPGSAWAVGARICRRDRAGEAAALEQAAACALGLSSLVTLDPPTGVGVEIGGSVGYFGGLHAVLERAEAGLEPLGLSVRSAVAPTPLAAALLARAGPGRTVSRPGELEAALAVVPVEHTGLPVAVLERLRKLGLGCLGDCMRLPRKGLGRRLAEVLVLLDRALGRVPDPRRPYELPSRFCQRLSLPVSVTGAEALSFAVNRLVHALADYLAARVLGVHRLALVLEHGDVPARFRIEGRIESRLQTRIDLSLVAATRDPSHLLGLLRERLERTRLPRAVDALTVEALAMAPLAPPHLDLLTPGAGREGGEADFARLLERLVARLGPNAVRGVLEEPDHRPERAWSAPPLGSGPGSEPGSGTGEPGRPRGRPGPDARAGLRPARPLLLLSEPAPLPAVAGRPRAGGELVLLSAAERIEAGWWDDGDVSRDYYVAVNPHGERLWIFEDRRQPGAWFLHGVFA